MDFAKSQVINHSAIEAINNYMQEGKIIQLRHLSNDCKKLLENAEKIIEVNFHEDSSYKFADDLLD